MCVMNQSGIKVADADMIVYKYITDGAYPSCYDDNDNRIRCLNIFHRATHPVTGRNIRIPCTVSYSNKAIGFEEGAGYTCFVYKPIRGRYPACLRIFIIKRGTRYKTGTVPMKHEFARAEVIQAETLEEFNLELI